MAAVLCGGIGKCFSGCCECVGQVCMAPFKLCGACAEGCGGCCKDGCGIVTSCCSSSLCLYITVACVLNIPPIVLGITDLPNLGNGCQASYWLIIFWLLCAINIIAAFYMARAIEKDDSILPTSNQQGMSNFDASGGAGRMKHLFCYDGWMAFYMIILVGFFAWLCLGAGNFVTDNEDEECDSTLSTVSMAYGFGWAFIFVGGCSLCCSLCCGVMFGTGGGGGNNGNAPYVNTNQQSATQSQPVAAASATASTNEKPTASTNSAAAKPTPVSASAPPEVPVASATPIYDNTPSKSASATVY